MIEINLLPHELRAARESRPGIQPKYLLYLMPAVAGIIIFIHFYLGLVSLYRIAQFKFLDAKWQRLAPEKKNIDELRRQYDLISQDAMVTHQLLSQRTEWSGKLNALSLSLPSGIWLSELSVSRKDVVIRGTALSLEKEGIGLVNKFMDGLKKNPGFMNDFVTLELVSVKSRPISGYDTDEFVLTAVLK